MVSDLQFLALFLGITVVFMGGFVPLSFEESDTLSNDTIQSPKKQLESGVLPNDVRCNEDRVLVVRDNGKVACVRESTAEKQDWRIIAVKTDTPTQEKTELLIQDDDSQNNDGNDSESVGVTNTTGIAPIVPILSDAKIVSSNYVIDSDNENAVGELGSGNFWPRYNRTMPEQVMIGEPFDVVLDFSFALPDANGGYGENATRCHELTCGDRYPLVVIYSENVELINRPGLVIEETTTDTEYTPNRKFDSGYVIWEYNNTGPQREVFTFIINEPTIDYNYGMIFVAIGSAMQPFYFNISDTGIVYLSEQKMGSYGNGSGQLQEDLSHLKHTTRAQYIIEQVGFEPPIEKLANFLQIYFSGENYQRLFVEMNVTQGYTDKFFEEYPDMKIRPTKEIADYFLKYSPGKSYEYYKEILTGRNFTQAYIDRFFEENPQMRTQSFVLPFNGIIPQTSDTDPSSSSVFLRGAQKS